MGLNFMKHGAFIFEHYEFRRDTGVLHLHYRYENGPAFEEQIAFPGIEHALSQNDQAALDASFRLLFLLAGTSYYKAYAPEHLKCTELALDEDPAVLMKKVYRKGLAEFAYRNKLDLSTRLRFASEAIPPRKASPLALPRRSL